MTLAAFPPDTLTFGAVDEQLRERIRDWISANEPETAPPEEFEARIAALVAWQRALHGAGLVGLSWPESYGGSGLDIAAEAVLAEELARTGMPEMINRIATYMVGPTIMDMGSDEQCARFLPGMLDAGELWCQGFSEPEAGSDLAAVRTSARLDGDEIVLNGQKVWTSRAQFARWCAALVRNDRDDRYGGLSLAVVDMEAPGVSVTALPQILGEAHFNEVFFDDVRVPVDNVIGGIGGGWKVAMQMLSYERGLLVLERQIRLRRRLDELCDELNAAGRASDPAVCERIGSVHSQLRVLEAQAYRTLAGQRAGSLRSGATSVDKLLLSHVYQELFALACDMLGADVALTLNDWTHDLLESRAVSIYSGTSQIQLDIVSRQLLGLPRSA